MGWGVARSKSTSAGSLVAPSLRCSGTCAWNWRRDLLQAPPDAAVTQIALRCGFNHLGRFAALYPTRHGESPSATLRRLRRGVAPASGSPVGFFSLSLGLPAVGVFPFNCIGNGVREPTAIAEEIAARLCRNRSIAVAEPDHARYQLRGKVQADRAGRLRVIVMLIDAVTHRYIWADRWVGDASESFAFEERVAARAAASIEQSVRNAEIDRGLSQGPRPTQRVGADDAGLAPRAVDRRGISG